MRTCKHKSCWCFVFDFLTAVFRPITLHYKIVMTKFVRRKILSQNNSSLIPHFEEATKNIMEYEKELLRHVRLQIGLETIFQVAGNAILLLYAESSTKTNQGLTAAFETDSFTIMGLNFSPKFLIILLLAINLGCYIKVQVSGIVEGHGSDYQFRAKLLLLMSIFCSSVIRISSMVLYFSPALGLFDLLHHYQGTLFHLNL